MSSQSINGLGQSAGTTAASKGRARQLFASLDQSAFTKRHAWLYTLIMVAHLTDGFDLLMLGVVLPGIIATFKLTPPQAGFLASSVFFGMTIGAVSITYLADRIGRKKAILLCVFLYSAFSLLAGFAWDYTSIVTMRFLQGLGLGAEVPIVLTYLLEFVPSRRRGILSAGAISLWQFAGLFAALIAIVIIPAFSWRGMFVLAAISSFLLILILTYIPESVRYLLQKDKIAEAERLVRGFSSVDPNTVKIETDLVALPKTHIWDILRGRYLRYTLGAWIMSVTWAMAYFGMSVWLPSILIRMGFTQIHSFAYTAAITGVGASGVLLSGAFMDWIGRRATTAACFLIGGASMIAWGFSATTAGILFFGMLTTFTGTGGVAGCLFTYICEIYPTQFRANGSGLATAWQRIGGMVAPSILGLLVGAKVSVFSSFVLLGTILIVGGVAALLLTYETRGKTLEQITQDLAG